MWWSLTLKLALLVWKLKVSSCLGKCEMVFGILMQCCISHLPLKSFVPLLVVVEPWFWWGLIWLCTVARHHASLPPNLLWASQNLGAGQDLGEWRFNHVIYGWDGWGVAFGDLPRVESLQSFGPTPLHYTPENLPDVGVLCVRPRCLQMVIFSDMEENKANSGVLKRLSAYLCQFLISAQGGATLCGRMILHGVGVRLGSL